MTPEELRRWSAEKVMGWTAVPIDVKWIPEWWENKDGKCLMKV